MLFAFARSYAKFELAPNVESKRVDMSGEPEGSGQITFEWIPIMKVSAETIAAWTVCVHDCSPRRQEGPDRRSWMASFEAADLVRHTEVKSPDWRRRVNCCKLQAQQDTPRRDWLCAV
jgi:hypothetical protein